MKKFFLLFALGLIAPFSFAHAEDAAPEKYIFQPEGCEFAITFPDEPYSRRQCNPDNPAQCTDITSYTKVFGIEATLNFDVTCYPVEEGMYDQFSEEVMRATLEAMLADRNLDEVETDAQTLPYAKQAVALGTGTSGQSDLIFTGQLWIGKKSIYTIEAELIGRQLDAADELFMDIIASIRHESQLAATEDEAPQDTKNSADDDKEDKEQE